MLGYIVFNSLYIYIKRDKLFIMPKFKPKIYIKDESFDPIYNTYSFSFYFKSRIVPAMLISMGILIFSTQVIFPLVFFKTHDKVTKPVSSSVLGIASGFSDYEFEELKNTMNSKQQDYNTPEFFYLTIPKLDIKDALIETNSLSLSPDETLGHYNGSALPGKTGNSFVYGHSVLPWFYNPRNYKTIFSTLDKLQPGDEIFIEYQNEKLTYVVDNQEVLKIEEVKPLDNVKPDYLNQSTMTLMTCWPPGTKAKRLVVNTTLVD